MSFKERARPPQLYEAPKPTITSAAFKEAVSKRTAYERELLALHSAAFQAGDIQRLPAGSNPTPVRSAQEPSAATPPDRATGAATLAPAVPLDAKPASDHEPAAGEDVEGLLHSQQDAGWAAGAAKRRQERQDPQNHRAHHLRVRQQQYEEAQRDHQRQLAQAAQQHATAAAASQERLQQLQELETKLKAMTTTKHGLVLKLKQVLQSEEVARQQAAALEALEEGEMLTTSLPPHLAAGQQPFRQTGWDVPPPAATGSSPLPSTISMPPHLAPAKSVPYAPTGRFGSLAPAAGSAFVRSPQWSAPAR